MGGASRQQVCNGRSSREAVVDVGSMAAGLGQVVHMMRLLHIFPVVVDCLEALFVGPVLLLLLMIMRGTTGAVAGVGHGVLVACC